MGWRWCLLTFFEFCFLSYKTGATENCLCGPSPTSSSSSKHSVLPPLPCTHHYVTFLWEWDFQRVALFLNGVQERENSEAADPAFSNFKAQLRREEFIQRSVISSTWLNLSTFHAPLLGKGWIWQRVPIPNSCGSESWLHNILTCTSGFPQCLHLCPRVALSI